LFGGAGVGKTVFIQELIVCIGHYTKYQNRLTVVEQHRQGSWWLLGLHRCG
jgi:F0F1-type ATP synthase beta subunit